MDYASWLYFYRKKMAPLESCEDMTAPETDRLIREAARMVIFSDTCNRYTTPLNGQFAHGPSDLFANWRTMPAAFNFTQQPRTINLHQTAG